MRNIKERALGMVMQRLDEVTRERLAALSSSPEMEKKLRKIVRDEIAAARAGMVNRARNALGNDPRGAAQSVRSSVYKSLLGAARLAAC